MWKPAELNRKESGIDNNVSSQEVSESESLAKQNIYREIIGLQKDENPDMFLVLDAGISQRSGNRWGPTSGADETANFPEADNPVKFSYGLRQTTKGNLLIGSGGGKARALAGVELEKYFPEAIIVTDSRYPVKQENSDSLTLPEVHSEIYAEFLERHGVPQEKIKQETDSTTTLEGLINFLEMAINEDKENLVIITNDYHIERTKEMLKMLTNEKLASTKLKYLIAKLSEDYRKKIGVEIINSEKSEIKFTDKSFLDKVKSMSIKIVSAEKILGERDPRYKKLFDATRNMTAYQKRVATEKKGITQLKKGNYGRPKN